jgi:hypothetical protein
MIEPAHRAGYHVFDNSELLMSLNEIWLADGRALMPGLLLEGASTSRNPVPLLLYYCTYGMR